MIDTHCHLEMSPFDGEADAVVQRAHDAGVHKMITIGSSPQSIEEAVALTGRYPSVYAAIGIHPHDARLFTPEIYRQIRDLSSNEKVVAIGETGLDYHYKHSPVDIQREVFIRHIALAKETNLPVVIHSREASDDVVSIIKGEGVSSGVLHCFSGDEKMAEAVMASGLYISISGTVTFKNSAALRAVVRTIPDDYLLVETDAPYLAPTPNRGKRNEPAYVTLTARAVAEIRGVSYEDIDRITTLNANRLFGLEPARPANGQITYKIRNSLYLNITNRCTNVCTFCVRYQTDFVKGHNLRLSREPSDAEIIESIGNPAVFDEVVFCGYGEPLMRLDTVINVSRYIKTHGGRVRINTNGLGCLIHKRDILPELSGLVDVISISLNAQDASTYQRLSHPPFEGAYEAVLKFIAGAKDCIPEVTATVVDAPGVDVEKCRQIAAALGATFRLRHLDVVG
ncbi:TatD family hydrolase [Candidatus Magnetominusculus dajiuhuensis]|uniref:TatD family hydrolase n=1 Tax=Candidatus Magnetominusculus dajiuhuensis TaxID=3137712 RepID=UPI003B43C17D